MFAVDVCNLPKTGGSMFVVFAGLFVLLAGVIVTRWVRQSAGRLSVVVAPLVLLGGFVLAPQVVDPCAPVPTPANGTLPELSSGVGQMTKEDGTVIQVPVQQVGQEVQIGTSEFYMALALETGSALYDNSSIILKSDLETIVTGAGFKPGSTVEVWLFSTPILLGTTIVLQDGTFSLPVTVPGNTPAGSHTLQAEGLTTAGVLRAVSAGVIVSKDVVSPVVLPKTGSQSDGWLIVGMFALIIGTVLVTRRRNLW
jgi:LPXTG-motif cell wall-anchored protein